MAEPTVADDRNGSSIELLANNAGSTTTTTTTTTPPPAIEALNNDDAAATATEASETTKSALQDNIERKGKNAYYFAHSHKATGPQWDGKVEPRLLSSSTTTTATHVLKRSTSAFDYSKSNITSYSFLDEPMKVKLYINLKDVGEQCTDEDIVLQSTERSFSLTVNNYQHTETTPCLCFGRLTGVISGASFKRKDHKIIVTLNKVEQDVEWHTINDKGAPDHDFV